MAQRQSEEELRRRAEAKPTKDEWDARPMRPSLKRPVRPFPFDPRVIQTPTELRKLAEHTAATDEWILDALEYLLERDAETNGCPGCGMVGKDFCTCPQGDDAPNVYDLNVMERENARG